MTVLESINLYLLQCKGKLYLVSQWDINFPDNRSLSDFRPRRWSGSIHRENYREKENMGQQYRVVIKLYNQCLTRIRHEHRIHITESLLTIAFLYRRTRYTFNSCYISAVKYF